MFRKKRSPSLQPNQLGDHNLSHRGSRSSKRKERKPRKSKCLVQKTGERERKKKGKKFVEGIVNRTSNARRAQVRGSRRAWNWSSDISRVSQGAANFSRIPLSSWRGATSINASRTRVAFRKLDAYPRRARVESPRGRGRALARRRDHGERGEGFHGEWKRGRSRSLR